MGQGGFRTTVRSPRCRPGTPAVVVLHPGELLDLARAGAAAARRHDQPVDASVVTAEGVVDLGLSPWRSSPPGAG